MIDKGIHTSRLKTYICSKHFLSNPHPTPRQGDATMATATGGSRATSRKARIIDLSGEAVKPMDHQAGGHKNTGAEEAPYLLRLGQDRLLKVFIFICVELGRV